MATGKNISEEAMFQAIASSFDGVDALNVNANLPNEGQQTMANSISVAIASNQSAVPVSGITGTEYTEGDVDATITGSAMMMEGAANTLVPAQGTAADGLLVNLGTNNDVTVASLPLPSGAATSAKQDTLYSAFINTFGPGTIDEFGHLVIGSVNNQIDVQFYRSDGSVGDLVTETNANGGTATATNGMATFSATTTSNSQAKGVSTTTTTYTAGAEIYAIFTAGFTGTGAGTSYQRIGLYNGTDGFYIGREANTFGISVIKGGSAVQTPQASFNVDTLSAGAGSRFTRAGVAESIDLTKLNVWRIRFGWVGSAPVNFEVLSPDGNWVTFHIIRQPNNAALPHINNADLPVTCDVNSGNSGNALTLITNCWGAGTTVSQSKLNSTLTTSTLAGLTRAVITGETTAGGGAFINVKVNPSGELTTASTLQSNSGVDVGDVTINNSTGAAAVNIQDGGNTITVDGTVSANATLSAETTKVIGVVRTADGSGNLLTSTTNALDINIKSGSIANTSFAVTNAGTFVVQDNPQTSGGLSKFHLVGAATTNATNIKASAGQLYSVTAFNVAATPAYLKFHNTAGTPTAGSGVTDTFLIPGNTSGAGLVINFDKGIVFSTGIGITITTGIADADTGAISASNVVVNIYYK